MISTSRIPTKTKTILLVDDDKGMYQSLQILFEKPVYKIVYAKDCASALKKLNDGLSADLIILDLFMPEVNGLRCLDNLQAITSVPVIMVSAAHEIQACAAAYEKGVKAYICKPFDNADIRKKVENLLFSGAISEGRK